MFEWLTEYFRKESGQIVENIRVSKIRNPQIPFDVEAEGSRLLESVLLVVKLVATWSDVSPAPSLALLCLQKVLSGLSSL